MKYLIIVAITALVSVSSYAEDKSNGCGVGWMLVKRQSLISSSVRQTTNSLLPNTLSMTSGTSGCSRHSIVKINQESIYYASANFDQILLESAQGEGQYLAGYAQTYGCKNVPLFNQNLKKYFTEIEKISGNDAALNLSIKVKTLIESDADLNLSCQG